MPAKVIYETPQSKAAKVIKEHNKKQKGFNALTKQEQDDLIAALIVVLETSE